MKKKKTQKFEQDGFYFLPVGGSEEFGVNFNVYAYDGEYLIIDCGIGFADERHPGIDLLLPDPAIMQERKDKISGLVITHAHEDHVGAVAYLYDRLECPIYATAFTAAVLRAKFKDLDGRAPDIKILKPLKEKQIGNFKIRPLSVSHSVPQAVALSIETPLGKVFHSGDWNLDPNPVVGEPTNAEHFKELAASNDGVLAYIGDSTNSGVSGRSGSERDVATGLEKEFKTCNNKIVVTTFSSNIGRIISIVNAAKACGREVGVIGRSLHRMIGSAKKCGMLQDIEFVPEDDLSQMPNDKMVVIMTGSQGEYRAALGRLSRGDLRSFSLKPKDTVIFSARAIPGNEKDINVIKNNLSAQGVTIITPRDTKNIIHVSGHPCQDEIAEMYQWLKPKTVIPVHGERAQLEDQARFAKSCQIAQVVVPQNGSVIQLAPGAPKIVDHMKTGLLAVDQRRIIDSDHRSISARRKLQYTGVVQVSLVLDEQGDLLGDPKLDTVGLVDNANRDDEKLLQSIYEETLDILDDIDWEERMDDESVAEEIRIGLRRFIFNALGVKPKTTVHVLRV